MDNRAKFYCWLIGKLERRHMTIQEICNDWVESSSNIDGKELSVRTFHRYREEIANLFGIEIECDKADGYRYFIRRDRYADGSDFHPRVLPFDRISYLEIVCEKQLLSKKTKKLLWHGRKIIVLSPDDFRQEMIGILKDMVRSYETGENTVEE